MTNPDITAVKTYLLGLQDQICSALEKEDGSETFHEDNWKREQGGGGRTRVMHGGSVFEQAGINFSHVHGDSLPESATAHRPELSGRSFQAVGVSLVIHPHNPYVPTSHANVRFFIAEKEGADPVWWFGGGFDLTPYYPFEEDALHWHKTAAAACEPFGKDVYARYKKWCDEYFYLKHRNEMRGIGGIFYDYLHSDETQGGWEADFAFTRDVGRRFAEIYPELVKRNMNTLWSEKDREEQLVRRGRYVEYNLLYDRGTMFGLRTGGNVDSILSSMPPVVKWP